MTHLLNEKKNLNNIPDTHQDIFSKTIFGFWIYLMTDCLLFTTLFVTYGVFRNSTFGGPLPQELFDLTKAFIETMLLLCSSVTCGFGMLSAVKSNRNKALFWFFITLLLALSFIAMEIMEFGSLVEKGNSWTRSAFLSAFFTLVGTHGLHVSVGALWLVVMMCQLIGEGITVYSFRRLVIFSYFWHFLDLIWIFIFTFVYLYPN